MGQQKGLFEVIRLKNLFQGIYRRCYSKNSINRNAMCTQLLLYGDEASPSVQFVMITASMLNIQMDFYHVNIFKQEHLSDFYSKINPLQKVPALQVYSDVIICDSHAIALFLCNSVSNTSESYSLYPTDPVTSAWINQLMLFNASTLLPINCSIFDRYFTGKWPPEEAKMKQWYSALDYLEYWLKKSQSAWLVNDQMCLADICCATTVGSLQVLVPHLERHVRVGAWMNGISQLPSFQIHLRGVRRMQAFLAGRLD